MDEQNLKHIQDWMADESFREWSQQKDPGYPQWENWLAENPGKRELAEIAAQMLIGISFQPIEIDEQKRQQALARAQARLESQTESPVKPLPISRKRRRFPYQIAASIALLLCLGGIWYYQVIWKAEIQIRTAYGETMSFVLPDDSEIVLNANSELSYFRHQPRKVWLRGEAFFEVQKKPESGARFQVITPDLTVEVLGTAFNVNSHREKTHVFLETGKVKLNLNHDEKSELQLLPGDLLAYSAQEQKILKQGKAIPEQVTSWRTGTLQFEKTELAEIVAKMEEIYGVSILVQEEEMKTRLMTMNMPIENLQIALATIESALGLSLQQVNEYTYQFE